MVGGELWVARVKTLEPGDHIRCLNFTDEETKLWMGGEVFVVLWAEPTGKRDGHWDVAIFVRDCPSETRKLCIRAEDRVCVVAREVPETKVPKQEKAKRPKKGDQLKLF